MLETRKSHGESNPELLGFNVVWAREKSVIRWLDTFWRCGHSRSVSKRNRRKGRPIRRCSSSRGSGLRYKRDVKTAFSTRNPRRFVQRAFRIGKFQRPEQLKCFGSVGSTRDLTAGFLRACIRFCPLCYLLICWARSVGLCEFRVCVASVRLGHFSISFAINLWTALPIHLGFSLFGLFPMHWFQPPQLEMGALAKTVLIVCIAVIYLSALLGQPTVFGSHHTPFWCVIFWLYTIGLIRDNRSLVVRMANWPSFRASLLVARFVFDFI